MKHVSIFNEVIGPVMRGPSSSHTAASYHIGRIVRDLLDGDPEDISIAFAEGGSYAEVYHQQGSDLGFASGLLGLSITDEKFKNALEQARKKGLTIKFTVEKFQGNFHPNAMEIRGNTKSGKHVKVVAKSIGGGAIVIEKINDWNVELIGDSYVLLVQAENSVKEEVIEYFSQIEGKLGDPLVKSSKGIFLIQQKHLKLLDNEMLDFLQSMKGVQRVWTTSPFFFSSSGQPLFTNGSEMISLATRKRISLGRIALSYEAQLLGISEDEAVKEMLRRYEIMSSGVEKGLKLREKGMQLLRPTANEIWKAEKEGRLAIGGLHTRAAVRALAVMHVNSSMGVVCAAPTGGAAGTIPGVITTLVEEKELNELETALALFAASGIGLILAMRGTFAAEVAGCQVEIGAAGAMAAAAVVEATGGSAKQAADAASISFQNTMGSVCDLVQGIVEIPCHTRNAVAASSAFVNADLIIGGYMNSIPLDETIDAVMSVGKMLPSELRCTAMGGLALTPSALAMKNLKEV
jgi:L-serine dehydratase